MSRTQELRIIHGDGHATQASYDYLRCRSLSRQRPRPAIGMMSRPPSLLRRFGHQWRRTDHRKPPWRASAIGQSLRLLIAPPHHEPSSMSAVTIGTLLITFLPFLLSLFGTSSQARVICLITSILALLLSVEEYGAVMPWVLGMIMAVVSVWERFRHRLMI
jgi:hypothetical protein